MCGVCVGVVGKTNLVKCFGPRLRLWTWTLCQGQALKKKYVLKQWPAALANATMDDARKLTGQQYLVYSNVR